MFAPPGGTSVKFSTVTETVTVAPAAIMSGSTVAMTDGSPALPPAPLDVALADVVVDAAVAEALVAPPVPTLVLELDSLVDAEESPEETVACPPVPEPAPAPALVLEDAPPHAAIAKTKSPAERQR